MSFINGLLSQAESMQVEPEILSNLRKIKSNIELLTVVWCLDQYIPLKSSTKNDIEIYYYEDMLRNIDKITSDLITKLGYKGKKYDNSVLNRPSITTINTLYQTEYQINKWKDFLLSANIIWLAFQKRNRRTIKDMIRMLSPINPKMEI